MMLTTKLWLLFQKESRESLSIAMIVLVSLPKKQKAWAAAFEEESLKEVPSMGAGSVKNMDKTKS